MISKTEFDSVELNCSIFFPLYCLIVWKKTDHFLQEIVRNESSDCPMAIQFLSCIGMAVVVLTVQKMPNLTAICTDMEPTFLDL